MWTSKKQCLLLSPLSCLLFLSHLFFLILSLGWSHAESSSPFILAAGKYRYLLGFPGGVSRKESACQHRKYKRCVRKIPWRRKWQPTPVFLPGKSHGQRSLVGYRPQGLREPVLTEHTHTCVTQAPGHWCSPSHLALRPLLLCVVFQSLTFFPGLISFIFPSVTARGAIFYKF